MHQVDITIKGKRHSYQVAAGWPDVMPKTWKRIMPIILTGNGDAQRIHILRELLQSKRGKRISKSRWNLLTPDHLSDMLHLVDWLWDSGMTSPIVSQFKFKGKVYVLPADKLENITLIEYAYVDFCYSMYVRNLKPAGNPDLAFEYLNKIVCYLCRPAAEGRNPDDADTWKGDAREKFNTLICDRRLPLFESLPDHIRVGVLLFFVGCKRHIHETNKGTIFSDTEIDGKEVIGAEPMKPQEWIDLCFALAGSKFGDLDNTMYTPLYTILYELRLQNMKK